MNDLNEFFSLISEAKKENQERLDEIVGSSFDEYFWEPLIKKRKKRKKIKSNENTTSLIGRGESNITSSNQSPSVSNSISEGIDNINEEESHTLIEKSLGLLSEPDNVKQGSDPLTPLDKKFITLEELNKHYSLFLSRIQQQLSTLGGGGETNLTYMDVPITSVNTSSYTIKPQDYYIGVNYEGAVTINLPKSDREGKIFIVKDELGEASKGTNRYITILPNGSDLIDGRDRAILAYDYGSLTFIWKGNSWRVI